ncbi:recombinase family protein [Streptomyces sp. NPDC002067]
MNIDLGPVPHSKDEIIRAAYDLYLSGHTFEEIAQAFTASGVPVLAQTSRRRPFRAPALKRLAQGPVTD